MLALHYFRLPSAIPVSKSLTIVSSVAVRPSSRRRAQPVHAQISAAAVSSAPAGSKPIRNSISVLSRSVPDDASTMVEGASQQTAGFGILPGRGSLTVSLTRSLKNALGTIVGDEGTAAHAIATVREGAVDIGDDIEGAYSGPALVESVALRKAAGLPFFVAGAVEKRRLRHQYPDSMSSLGDKSFVAANYRSLPTGFGLEQDGTDEAHLTL